MITGGVDKKYASDNNLKLCFSIFVLFCPRATSEIMLWNSPQMKYDEEDSDDDSHGNDVTVIYPSRCHTFTSDCID